MIKILLALTLLIGSIAAQAQTLTDAQELIANYLKSAPKSGDVTSSAEMQQIGSIHQALEKLSKEDYKKSIEFLRDNWMMNSQNSQRLFIFLQRRWQSDYGTTLALTQQSKELVAGELGLSAGTAATVLYTANLLRPALALKRNPFGFMSYNWSSGFPLATTYGATSLLTPLLSSGEAEKNFLLNAKPSPSSVMKFPYAEQKTEKIVLNEREIESLYKNAVALGLSGLATEILKLRSLATGVKMTGSTAGRVVWVMSLAAAIGFTAETSIDIYVQNHKFDKLHKDLKSAVNELEGLNPLAPTAQILAQNVYTQTNNLVLFQMLPYFKATQENLGTLQELQKKVATSVFQQLPNGSWEKNSTEAELYLAYKDIRDGFLNTIKNEECQYQVDLYVLLSRLVDTGSLNMPENFSLLNARSQQTLQFLKLFIEKQKQQNPDQFLLQEQTQAFTQNVAKAKLDKLKAHFIENFSQGKICGGALSGHPLHTLLAASLFLKNFSTQQTWLQTSALDQRFHELFVTRINNLKINLKSPNERKIEDGELIDISEFWKRKGFKKPEPQSQK